MQKGIKFRNLMLLAVFICLISFPLMNGEFIFIKDIESTENRKAADAPKLDISFLDGFPPAYDKYYSDNFSIRQILVKYYNLLQFIVFKKSPMPNKVLIGDDDFMFLGESEVDNYMGENRLGKDEMEAIRLELEYRKKYLEERGCKFYFVIAPIKANIYAEVMPKHLFRKNKQCWGEQLIEYLNVNSSVKPIDIYNTLRQNKQYGQMYYKLDNHWTKKGAYFAADEMLHRISKDVSSVTALPYSSYNVKHEIITHGNIVNMVTDTKIMTDSAFELTPKSGFMAAEFSKVGYAVPKEFPYPWEYENVRVIPNSNKPKLLIISDSFGANIFPFLSENFSRNVKIFDAWKYKLHEEIVDKEKPDVVILMVIESNIRTLLWDQSRLKKDS